MGGFTVMAGKMRGRIVANPILEDERMLRCKEFGDNGSFSKA